MIESSLVLTRTVRAQPGDFDVVRLGLEAMLGGGGANEGFDVGRGDGYRAAAAQAGEVVMVTVVAVGELNEAVAGHHDVFNDPEAAEERQSAIEAGSVSESKVVAYQLSGGNGAALVQVCEHAEP